ncbi:MAG: peptide-methionine (S)-S-oxide reductase MsrA [Fidelibacterota bacterium]
MNPQVNLETATLAGGCFWCVEAVFERVEGVIEVISGYSGGHVENPTYQEVSSGKTGHAEVCQIQFNPDIISYEHILDIFWQAHDPTTPNRQGADVGSQYRSIIFYHNNEQRTTAETSKNQAAKNFDQPIVTEIVPFSKFYKAENYHQDYFKNNPDVPYCTFVIQPKLEKLKKHGDIFN